jgi:hypothetical protein
MSDNPLPDNQMSDNQTDSGYDPDAIFNDDSPIDPIFMADAIQTLMRAMPLNTVETENAKRRHWQAGLTALAATNPRDPIEVMLAVQAMSAYQAASACWRVAMNSRHPSSDSPQQISAACTAARTFDAMLRAIERRQARPLAAPKGRPVRRAWCKTRTGKILDSMAERITRDNEAPAWPQLEQSPMPAVIWTPGDVAFAEAKMKQDRIAEENAGLDLANTEGILLGGGMIMPADPTPQQAAYIGRRMGLAYKREYAENLRRGFKIIPKIKPLRTGDLIP